MSEPDSASGGDGARTQEPLPPLVTSLPSPLHLSTHICAQAMMNTPAQPVDNVCAPHPTKHTRTDFFISPGNELLRSYTVCTGEALNDFERCNAPAVVTNFNFSGYRTWILSKLVARESHALAQDDTPTRGRRRLYDRHLLTADGQARLDNGRDVVCVKIVRRCKGVTGHSLSCVRSCPRSLSREACKVACKKQQPFHECNFTIV